MAFRCGQRGHLSVCRAVALNPSPGRQGGGVGVVTTRRPVKQGVSLPRAVGSKAAGQGGAPAGFEVVPVFQGARSSPGVSKGHPTFTLSSGCLSNPRHLRRVAWASKPHTVIFQRD